MESLRVRKCCVGPVETNCYILFLEGRKDCLVIDPGDEPETILQAADGRAIDAILFTHGHFDHIGAGQAILGEKTRVLIHEEDAPMLSDPRLNAGRMLMGIDCTGPAATELVKDGDLVHAAGLELRVLHTPGHTRGSVCYLLEYDGAAYLFSGDTVMALGYGRTDLPGGSDADMMASLARLRPYLTSCRVLGGHG